MNVGQSCTYTKKTFKVGPSSTVITIPRGLGIDPGDEVEVTIRLLNKNTYKNEQEDSES